MNDISSYNIKGCPGIYLLYLYRFSKVRKEMARTFKDIEIEGKNTGSLRSYITNYESGIFLRSNCEAFFGKAFLRKV